MNGVIYSLSCPDSGLVRYIGQTKQKNPLKRFHQHKYQFQRCSKSMSYVNCWIKSLYQQGKVPVFEIIESDIPENHLSIEENNYIKLFKAMGAKLTNIQDVVNEVHVSFSQKESSKEKRLKTLSVSDKWKTRSLRHSQIMINKFKDPTVKIGFRCLSKDQLSELNKRSLITRQKKVCSVDNDDKILEVFDSVKEAAIFYGIKDSTHIVRVCKGKNKSGKTYGIKFKYMENDLLIAKYNAKGRSKKPSK